MKSKDFAALGKRLLGLLPDHVVKGPMIFETPIVHTLKGIYFEGSSFDSTSFYAWVFFLPLCVPTEHISFNLGKRIGAPRERWSIDDPDLIEKLSRAIEREAIPFLADAKSAKDIADKARDFAERGDVHAIQSAAYSFAYAGEEELALRYLNLLLEQTDESVEWHQDIAQQARELLEALETNPSEAKRYLDDWICLSVKNMKLERFFSR